MECFSIRSESVVLSPRNPLILKRKKAPKSLKILKSLKSLKRLLKGFKRCTRLRHPLWGVRWPPPEGIFASITLPLQSQSHRLLLALPILRLTGFFPACAKAEIP